MNRLMMLLLLAIFVLPLAAVAEDTVPAASSAAPAKKAKKPKKAKKTVSNLPRVNADVRNLKVGQEGDQAVATFDLVSSEGEGVAEVTVAIIIDGKRRTSGQLSLTGDFGKDVRPGVGKRIVWKALADLPKGFDGEIDWDVTTVKALTARVMEKQPKPEQKVEGPGLEETMAWLRGKLDNVRYNTSYASLRYANSNSFTYNGCNIVYKKEEIKEYTENKDTSYTLHEALLSDAKDNYFRVGSKSITGSSESDIWEVSINVSHKRTSDSGVSNNDFISFEVVSRDVAQRVATALKRAVELCHKIPKPKSNELY